MNPHFHKLVLIAVLALGPIGLSAFAWRCNSVSLHLKFWAVEYKFEKGSCATSAEQLQIEPPKKENQ